MLSHTIAFGYFVVANVRLTVANILLLNLTLFIWSQIGFLSLIYMCRVC